MTSSDLEPCIILLFLIGFTLTLNDRKWPFDVNFFFEPYVLRLCVLAFRDDCVKINTYILSAAIM